jgi:hypothetical protein
LAKHSNVTNQGQGKQSKLTALFTVRRWLRETPCSASQSQVLFALAAFADPDGTSIHPGIDDLERITKLDRTTVMLALKVWRGVAAITRTKCGNRQRREADEYKINLDWQASKVGPSDFCISRAGRPMKVHKSDEGGPKVGLEGSKVGQADPTEVSFTEESFTEESTSPPLPPTNTVGGIVDPEIVATPIPRRRSDPRARNREDKRLGLTVAKFVIRPTRADHNALLIRNAEAGLFVPLGTYEQVRLVLLESGGTFTDDPRVLVMVDQIMRRLYRK